jgi:hypothetical protein
MDNKVGIPHFEVPADVRAMTEKSMEQARVAFNAFMSAAQRATSHFEDQAKAVQAGAKDVSDKAMSYAERNVANTFAFADRLVHAKEHPAGVCAADRICSSADEGTRRAGEGTRRSRIQDCFEPSPAEGLRPGDGANLPARSAAGVTERFTMFRPPAGHSWSGWKARHCRSRSAAGEGPRAGSAGGLDCNVIVAPSAWPGASWRRVRWTSMR